MDAHGRSRSRRNSRPPPAASARSNASIRGHVRRTDSIDSLVNQLSLGPASASLTQAASGSLADDDSLNFGLVVPKCRRASYASQRRSSSTASRRSPSPAPLQRSATSSSGDTFLPAPPARHAAPGARAAHGMSDSRRSRGSRSSSRESLAATARTSLHGGSSYAPRTAHNPAGLWQAATMQPHSTGHVPVARPQAAYAWLPRAPRSQGHEGRAAPASVPTPASAYNMGPYHQAPHMFPAGALPANPYYMAYPQAPHSMSHHYAPAYQHSMAPTMVTNPHYPPYAPGSAHHRPAAQPPYAPQQAQQQHAWQAARAHVARPTSAGGPLHQHAPASRAAAPQRAPRSLPAQAKPQRAGIGRRALPAEPPQPSTGRDSPTLPLPPGEPSFRLPGRPAAPQLGPPRAAHAAAARAPEHSYHQQAASQVSRAFSPRAVAQHEAASQPPSPEVARTKSTEIVQLEAAMRTALRAMTDEIQTVNAQARPGGAQTLLRVPRARFASHWRDGGASAPAPTGVARRAEESPGSRGSTAQESLSEISVALHRVRETLPPRMAGEPPAARPPPTGAQSPASSASPGRDSASPASKGQTEKLLELETILDSLYEFLPALKLPGQQLAEAERIMQQASDTLRAQVRPDCEACALVPGFVRSLARGHAAGACRRRLHAQRAPRAPPARWRRRRRWTGAAWHAR